MSTRQRRRSSETLAMMDRPPSNMTKEMLHVFADAFGIHKVEFEGKKQWAIDLNPATDSSFGEHAFFDAKTKVWSPRRSARPNESTPMSLASGSPLSPPSVDQMEYFPQVNNNYRAENWADLLPDTPHNNLFKNVHWSNTPLGALGTWPISLRLYVHNILFQPAAPMVIHWGQEQVAIYNESFIPLIGTAHPRFMGASFKDDWHNFRDPFEGLFRQLEISGTGTDVKNYCLFVAHIGYVQETWWRASLFPLAKDDGTSGGCTSIWEDQTRQVLSDRRTKMLNDLGHFDINNASFWQHTLEVLSTNGRDVAMAILYSAQQYDESEDKHILHLEGTVGFATGHAAAPPEVDLKSSQVGFAPAMRKAREQRSDWLSLKSEEFPEEVVEKVNWQGYEDQSRIIVVIPLRVVSGIMSGFIVIGLNPRRDFDDDHQQFVTDLRRQMITILTSVLTVQQAKRREDSLTHDLAESERRIRTMAEFAPMGMYDLSRDGVLVWANHHFFDLVGSAKPARYADFSWKEVIHEDDQEQCGLDIIKCTVDQLDISNTIRLKRKWTPPNDGETHAEEHVWVFYSAFPHIENGAVSSIMGCMTDVSSFKWAEAVQAESAEEARKARQRQNEFIDIVSHELRNPLSAITQSADDIVQSTQGLQASTVIENLHAIQSSILEAAESILLCAGHQRRIVDDILTLSKLDSALISVVPTSFQPDLVKDEVMRMFQAEYTSNNIDIETFAKQGEHDMADYVVADSSRIMQILVNLLTNAIKFTKSEPVRKIQIQYGACNEVPSVSKFGDSFAWSESSLIQREDPTISSDYGTGDALYLFFSVQDSGQGLKREDAVKIFEKFKQASRRTHIKYGGSGLGLFICRELAEMQGGKIGVQSAEGIGSKFAFYVKCRKSTAVTARRNGSPKASRSIRETDNVPHEVLLVEDNILNQKVLAKQLRKVGCTVHVANHGGEAVDFVLRANSSTDVHGRATRVDCILMDWEMPVLDGLAATQRLRQLEDEGVLPERQLIIGITANARSEQIQAAMESGMDAVVVKPFRVPDLLAKIRDLLSANS